MEIVDRPKNQSGRIQKSCQYCSEYNDKASKGSVCCVTHIHPAIITQELFEMAQAETRRRKDEKDAAAGTSRYTSKYPFSVLLICGTCGHRLRRHVRTVGSGKRVAAWGCTNRISNGRATCDSRHINEDMLERTYRAAIESLIGSTDDVIDTVSESCVVVLADGNHAELHAVQQQIIELQEAALTLHKSKQQYSISDTAYDVQVKEYSRQMAELQQRQQELKAQSTRYAEAKYWLDEFRTHMQAGGGINTEDALILRSVVEKIIVLEDRISIHLRCGIKCSGVL